MSSIFAFSKRIKEGDIVHQEIIDDTDVVKIGQVVQKLIDLSKSTVLAIDEIELRTLPRKWTTLLLGNYASKKTQEMEYLLLDFTDSMRTRMREETKYAIGLLMQDKLLLCHSFYGEETITPEWKIIPRMLDTDNVLRYVLFTNEKGIIQVRFWERDASSSFIEWLGLQRKQAFLFGGKYRICSELDGITTEFQLTEEEMERWIANHTELRDGKIQFPMPVQIFTINEIRVGRRRYDNPGDFIQDYEAEKYGIPKYRASYEKINSSLEPLFDKYYDERTQVVRMEGDTETIVVTKSSAEFDLLFVNQYIILRANYVADIVKRLVNGEAVKIHHVGIPYKSPPFIIRNLGIYNPVQRDAITQIIVNFCNETNLQDSFLIRILEYTIFKNLADVNHDVAISYLFSGISEEILKLIRLEGKWTKIEDKILEYKSENEFAGSNDEIIGKLKDDFAKKLQDCPCKLYLIGVEDNGVVRPIPSSRLKSDRIEVIRNGLQTALNFATFYACPITVQKDSILMIAALKNI